MKLFIIALNLRNKLKITSVDIKVHGVTCVNIKVWRCIAEGRNDVGCI